MATYNSSLKGYVADVPRVVFKRCDGQKFYMDELLMQQLAPLSVMTM